MKQLWSTFIILFLFSNVVFAADAIVWINNQKGSDYAINLANIKVRHIDNSVDEYMKILASDGSKLSIPFSALDSIYIRGNNYVVKTKSGQENFVPILQGMEPHFIGDNEIGGTTSFSAKYMKNIMIRQ